MIEQLAMLVVSCDGYTELGKIFFELQKKYMGWFSSSIYFINESLDVVFDNVTVIHAGKDKDWSGRLKYALKFVQEKYVLFMLEDYFIGKPVSEETIEEAVSVMEKNNLKYYKITNIPRVRNKGVIAEYLPGIPDNLRYGINLQAAIFEKSFLEELVSGEDRSAWKTETDLIKSVKDKYSGDIHGCVVDTRNIIDIHNGVIKGKWYGKTLKYFADNGYKIDVGNRNKLSFWQTFSFELSGIVSHMLPTAFLRKVKKVLKLLGAKFLSED